MADGEMVGVLILGIQSLDRAARAPASCQSLQFVTVGAHWDRGKLSKSQVCVCRAPPWDTAEARAGWSDPPDVTRGREGGGDTCGHPTPHTTDQ